MQPTFELEPDSPVYLSVIKDIDVIKTKYIDENNCDTNMPPTPMVSIDNSFETPNKAFLKPRTPKQTFGVDDATTSSEAVKGKAQPFILYADNTSSINIIRQNKISSRSRHLDIPVT